MTCVKVTSIGDSPAIILPPEVVGRLRLAKGDTLELRETSAGIELVPCALGAGTPRENALRAVTRLQHQSASAGRDQISDKSIDREIQQSRRKSG